jgi:hypothetical protein
VEEGAWRVEKRAAGREWESEVGVLVKWSLSSLRVPHRLRGTCHIYGAQTSSASPSSNLSLCTFHSARLFSLSIRYMTILLSGSHEIIDNGLAVYFNQQCIDVKNLPTQ